MHLAFPPLAIYTLLIGVDFYGLAILIIIISIPCFFVFRKVYRKRFGTDQGKVVGRSVIASLLTAFVLLVIVLAAIIGWSSL